MSKAAARSLMEELHSMTAEAMIAELREGNRSPQFLSAILKFLKDNGIEAARDVDNSKARELLQELNNLDDDGIADFVQ